MNEIQRLQQLAGILTEIKVNNPSPLIFKIGSYMGPNDEYDLELFYKDNIICRGIAYGDPKNPSKIELIFSDVIPNFKDKMENIKDTLSLNRIPFEIVVSEEDVFYSIWINDISKVKIQ